ncbi:MAG: ClbS/DfsB family four-helix bundle protein [Ktedonobacteraceae bacterium]|nr:ClbS/DfsB family four-helix bundle protein [Ktedonobacteraceae bacterium]
MNAQPFQAFLLDLLRQAQISQNTFFQELPAGSLEIIGEPDSWSAKDHVAHLTFWRQRLTLRLQAHFRTAPQPKIDHFEQLNPIVFEENRYRAWLDILVESDQAYADLIEVTEQLSDEDLTASDRFDWMPDGMPLCLSFMGNCYEHTQIHLGYYFLERHDLARATNVYEVWTRNIVEAEVPRPLKGNILYNLACFYALNDQLEKAVTSLERALELAPELKEWSLKDSDLDALRAKQVGQTSEED